MGQQPESWRPGSGCCSQLAAGGHCAYPLSHRLPGGFTWCAFAQEGKTRTVAVAREASADLSIFRPTVHGRPALAPRRGGEPPPRQPRRRPGTGDKAHALSFPGCMGILRSILVCGGTSFFTSTDILRRIGENCKSGRWALAHTTPRQEALCRSRSLGRPRNPGLHLCRPKLTGPGIRV
jgi:hypothetical protein